MNIFSGKKLQGLNKNSSIAKKDHNLFRFLQKLKKENIEIQVIYDIGAYKGEYTRLLSRYFQKSHFFLFEANPHHANNLKKTNKPYFICLLYSHVTQIPFFKIDTSGDSIYRENNFADYEYLKPILIETSTLDLEVKKNKIPLPDFVKIDTQGSELDIVRGGEQTLRECKIITLEVPLVTYNLGAPNISEYISTMKEYGFVPFDLVETHYDLGVLIQMDLAFINRTYLLEKFGKSTRRFL